MFCIKGHSCHANVLLVTHIFPPPKENHHLSTGGFFLRGHIVSQPNPRSGLAYRTALLAKCQGLRPTRDFFAFSHTKPGPQLKATPESLKNVPPIFQGSILNGGGNSG